MMAWDDEIKKGLEKIERFEVKLDNILSWISLTAKFLNAIRAIFHKNYPDEVPEPLPETIEELRALAQKTDSS